MISVFVHDHGVTRTASQVDPAWLAPDSGVQVWVDLAAPTDDDLRVLSDVFGFHPLSVEDARSALQFPKIEPYPGYLYLVLHGVNGTPAEPSVVTADIDFFVGRNYLVTVHAGDSKTITELRGVCDRHQHVWSDGPVGLLHRIVDAIVDNYRPTMEAIEARIEEVEDNAFSGVDQDLVRRVLELRRELAAMRRILIPQRDAVGRLARREFAVITDEMTYRFRDVYDHVVRLTDETLLFQDRVTGLQEVHLAAVSNRLNQVMKVLTVMSTIFLPLTVVTSLWGMNVALPVLPGGPAAQFWWVVGGMAALSAVMLAGFRRKGWL